jgi:hypothetical protein
MAARAEDAAVSAEALLFPPEGGGALTQPVHNSITVNAKSASILEQVLFIADILPPLNLIDF